MWMLYFIFVFLHFDTAEVISDLLPRSAAADVLIHVTTSFTFTIITLNPAALTHSSYLFRDYRRI